MSNVRILEKPVSGWTNINIGDKTFKASYLTDVPFEFLFEFKAWFKVGIPPIIIIDGEDTGQASIIVGKDETYLWLEDGEKEESKMSISNNDFIRQVINEIKEDIDDWVTFYYDFPDKNDYSREREFKEKKNEMLSLIMEIENFLQDT